MQISDTSVPLSGSPAVTRPVDGKAKIIYGIGHIANYIKSLLFGIFSLYFYTTVLGLPGKLVGIAIAIGLLWDAVIDPVIGTISDQTQGQLGKRHGFMLIGSIGMGISFWAYFSPPATYLSNTSLFFWLLVTSLLIRTTTSIFSIPYYALGAELCHDYHGRTSIVSFRGLFALIGAIATVGLTFLMFFPTTQPGIDPKLNVTGYYSMGFFAGLMMTIAGLISTLGTMPYRQFASDAPGTLRSDSVLSRFFAESRMALQNNSFRLIFISYSVFFLGTVINVTLSTHFLTFFVQITESKALSAFHLSFYFGALPGIVFWMHAGKYIDKRWIYFIGSFATASIMCSAFFLLGENRIFGIGNLPPLILGHAAAGFFGSVLWIIPASMIADVADEDEWINGRRREGLFFGMFNFGEQIAAGASLLIAGALIDVFAGLVPGTQEQSTLTVERVGMLYSILPAILLITSAFVILGYSLNKKKVGELQINLGMKDQK
jgi:GPH family glycoside/pentoside/hexuronide:cation symporter